MGTFLAFIGFLAILVAIVMLIVSLVKKNGKVKQWLIIGAVSFVVFVIGAILSPKLEKSNETKTANSPTATEISSSPTATEKQEEHVSYKEVKSYKKGSDTWKVIVFTEKPTNDELIKVAKELHSKDKTSYFHLFDSEEKVQEYIDWDVNYGKVKDKDGKVKLPTECSDVDYCLNLVKQQQYAYPCPESWVNEHELGLINQMAGNWQLSTSYGEKISDL